MRNCFVTCHHWVNSCNRGHCFPSKSSVLCVCVACTARLTLLRGQWPCVAIQLIKDSSSWAACRKNKKESMSERMSEENGSGRQWRTNTFTFIAKIKRKEGKDAKILARDKKKQTSEADHERVKAAGKGVPEGASGWQQASSLANLAAMSHQQKHDALSPHDQPLFEDGSQGKYWM